MNSSGKSIGWKDLLPGVREASPMPSQGMEQVHPMPMTLGGALKHYKYPHWLLSGNTSSMFSAYCFSLHFLIFCESKASILLVSYSEVLVY